MITHYIPQWMLDEFREEGLYEREKASGKTERRSLKNAASDHDLWAADIEKELMTKHDTEARQIYFDQIRGKDRIALAPEERSTFANWLSLFYPRVPNSLENIKQRIQAALDDPELIIQTMHERRAESLDVMRRANPTKYDIGVVAWGREQWEEAMLIRAAERMRINPERYLPSIEYTRDLHLRTMGEMLPQFAKHLCRYEWVWLRSPSASFIIGDNPLLRWSERLQRWDMGMARSGVEITIPLSSKLCLWMRKPQSRRDGRVVACGRSRVDEFNRRQTLGAISATYASRPELFDPRAKYGIY